MSNSIIGLIIVVKSLYSLAIVNINLSCDRDSSVTLTTVAFVMSSY